MLEKPDGKGLKAGSLTIQRFRGSAQAVPLQQRPLHADPPAAEPPSARPAPGHPAARFGTDSRPRLAAGPFSPPQTKKPPSRVGRRAGVHGPGPARPPPPPGTQGQAPSCPASRGLRPPPASRQPPGSRPCPPLPGRDTAPRAGPGRRPNGGCGHGFASRFHQGSRRGAILSPAAAARARARAPPGRGLPAAALTRPGAAAGPRQTPAAVAPGGGGGRHTRDGTTAGGDRAHKAALCPGRAAAAEQRDNMEERERGKARRGGSRGGTHRNMVTH